MGSENAHECTPNAENGFFFDFLDRYHKDGYEFLSHVVRATGAETWDSFVNAETKEQSPIKPVDTHTFTKQAEIV
jgi:hypothetical protein